MSKIPYRVLAWLSCILVFSFILIRTGRYSFASDTSVTSTSAQGLSAFSQLLAESGYNVRAVSRLPKETKNSFVVVPIQNINSPEFYKTLKAVDKSNQVTTLELLPEFSPTEIKASKVSWATNSERAVSLTIRMRSVDAKSVKDIEDLFDSPGSEFESDAEANSGGQLKEFFTKNTNSNTIMSYSSQNLALVRRITSADRPTITRVMNASFLQNELIDRPNSAAFALGVLRSSIKDPEQPVILVTGFVGNERESTLIEALGPAAHGAYNQFIALIVVVVATWSIRMGFPQRIRAEQRGSRDVVTAIADFTESRNQDHWALMQMWNETLGELERRNRVSRTQILSDPVHFLGPERAKALIAVRDKLNSPPPYPAAYIESARLLGSVLGTEGDARKV